MSYNFKTLTALRSGETPSTTPPGLTPPGQTTPPGSTPPGSTPPSTGPTSGSLSALLPYGNPNFTSGYKTTSRPNHQGLDYGVNADSPVINTQDGKVVAIYKNFGGPFPDGNGDAVVVQYTDGFKGVYGHIIPSVKVGDSVKKGNMIGKVKYWPNGRGNKDNTHLHYERITPNGQHVNPSGYVNSLEAPKTNISRESLIPLSGDLKGLKLEVLGGGKGGGRNLSYNKSSMGGKNVMIMAIQPVETFIPMPYPMPIEKESSSESSDQYQVSSIWRA